MRFFAREFLLFQIIFANSLSSSYRTPLALVNFKLISSKQKTKIPKENGNCWTASDDDIWTEIKMFLMRFFVVRRRCASFGELAGSIFRECSTMMHGVRCIVFVFSIIFFVFHQFHLFMASPMRITDSHKHHHPFAFISVGLISVTHSGVPFACLFWRIELKRKGKNHLSLVWRRFQRGNLFCFM